MYKKGAGNDKQGKDAGNRTLCPYRNFSQTIMSSIQVQVEEIKQTLSYHTNVTNVNEPSPALIEPWSSQIKSTSK